MKANEDVISRNDPRDVITPCFGNMSLKEVAELHDYNNGRLTILKAQLMYLRGKITLDQYVSVNQEVKARIEAKKPSGNIGLKFAKS